MIHYTLDDLLWVLSGTGTVSSYPSKRNMIDLMRAWDLDTSERMKQQFTGLLDKNGKEIYEGDILSCEFPNRNANYQRVMEWEEGMSNCCECSVDGYSSLDLDSARVIGNIYENPDLLVKK